MEAPTKATCKSCKEYKLRVQDGMFDARNKRFVDHTGRAWNGRRCPDCHGTAARKNMQHLRFKEKYGLNEKKEEGTGE